VEQIARELGNVVFAVAVAWYLLTKIAVKLDALADEIRSLRFSIEKLANRHYNLPYSHSE
jgi:hypothetical protein